MPTEKPFNRSIQPLRDKAAIVTGASRGIGRAIALRLAEAGASVLLCARTEHLLDEAVNEIQAAGGRAASLAIDLREAASGRYAVKAAAAAFGRVDVVVNNAGATKRGDFETLTDADWADGFDLKFFGAVRLTRAAWPHLREAGGAVVNIAGSGGRTPGAEFTIGGSVNAAMLSFTKAMAEVGLRDGVQVNAINPGPVRTSRLEGRLGQIAEKQGVDAAEALKIFLAGEKMTRVGEPEDIAELVLFLLSPHGRYVHGAALDADGGLTKTL